MSYKEYLKGYNPLDRDPVMLPQGIKEAVVLITSGFVVFGVWEPSADQMAWLLQASAFVGLIVAGVSRRKTWPDERVQNEFIGHDGLPQEGGVKTELEGYGEVFLTDEE